MEVLENRCWWGLHGILAAPQMPSKICTAWRRINLFDRFTTTLNASVFQNFTENVNAWINLAAFRGFSYVFCSCFSSENFISLPPACSFPRNVCTYIPCRNTKSNSFRGKCPHNTNITARCSRKQPVESIYSRLHSQLHNPRPFDGLSYASRKLLIPTQRKRLILSETRL